MAKNFLIFRHFTEKIPMQQKKVSGIVKLYENRFQNSLS